MTEPVEPQPAPEPPADAPRPEVTRPKRLRLSLVWIVPIAALVVGLALVARTVLQTGPTITIEFRTADGIDAGRTEVRFKEVVVGRVTGISLAEDRQHVLIKVSLQKSVENMAVADSRFWVVRPRVGTAGVSGLGTLLSGAYIGVDAGVAKEKQDHFVGLEAAPFVLRGEPGRSFTLNAEDLGSLDVGSPVYYRRTRVGRVVGSTLDPARDTLAVQVFIESPYESLVTRNSRFWNASGVDLSLDARGLTVNTQSLASVIGGGVAFASPRRSSATPPAPEGQRFTLFGSQQQALAPPDGQPLRIRMRFQQSSRGLAVGAPIDLLGVDIGSVRSVTLQYDEAGMRFPVEVIADIYPGRLGAVRSRVIEAQEASSPLPEDDLFMKRLIDAGLRAQLRTANLLTGQLFVALDFMPRAPKVVVDESKEVLAMPTVPGTLSELQPQLAQIISRLGQVRFDRIGNELEGTLKNAGAASLSLKQTLADAGVAIKQLSPEAQRALADVQKTLASMQATLEAFDHGVTDPESALQRNANQALVELQRTAEALRVLSDYIQQHPESLLRGKPADRDVTKSTGGSK